jgi:hypothetical protein
VQTVWNCRKTELSNSLLVDVTEKKRFMGGTLNLMILIDSSGGFIKASSRLRKVNCTIVEFLQFLLIYNAVHCSTEMSDSISAVELSFVKLQQF